MAEKKHGDFTGLAENYSKFRPAYSEEALDVLLQTVGKKVSDIDYADVGAGTGIWCRMVVKRGVKSAVAVEPNDDMRRFGIEDSKGLNVRWLSGSGENTTLETNSIDLLSMASSFHWVDFEKGTAEFHRVLRSGGVFTALWNPRYIESNPLLVEIENKLYELAPHIKRYSSGRSGLTEVLKQKLTSSPYFTDVQYVEKIHTARQTPEQYLGVWWSVNDIRVQAGEKIFSDFMQFVEKKVSGLKSIDTDYLTRMWIARKK